ncbi:alcohol dehydrogenase catalytic domain-containing protein [Photorhabdus asymbiotica]|uniref:alcohol dehydrogenase catalytic domain-containing protein n=1 Tax=Photorhabdus asymbiotica TaxID=291112 RepID=UPI003DA76A7E
MENKFIYFHSKYCQLMEEIINDNPVNHLLIKVEAAGLCGTDLQILKGIRKESTGILGHEGIGTVVNDYNSKNTFFKKGLRVIINPTDKFNSSFLLGHNVPGLFQQYISIPAPAVEDDVIIPVDFTLPHKFSSLIEPISVALHSIDISQQFIPDKYVIFGGGIIGNLIGLLLNIKYNINSNISLVHGNMHSKILSETDIVPYANHYLYDDILIKKTLENKRVAVFITTPRTATNHTLEFVLQHTGSNSIINIIGGINETTPIENEDISKIFSIRASNICNNINEQKYYIPKKHKNSNEIMITGQRGVPNSRLLESISILNAHHLELSKMITHVVDFNDFSQFLNLLITSNNRIIDGKYVLKAAMLH